MLFVKRSKICSQVSNTLAIAPVVIEELGMVVQHMLRDFIHVMGPLRECLFRCFEKETSLLNIVSLGRVIWLQVIRCLVKSPECVSDVFTGLGCNTQILSQSAHLLVQIDVAFLRLGGYPHNPLAKHFLNLVNLVN